MSVGGKPDLLYQTLMLVIAQERKNNKADLIGLVVCYEAHKLVSNKKDEPFRPRLLPSSVQGFKFEKLNLKLRSVWHLFYKHY